MARAPGAHGKQQFGIGAFVPLGLQGVAADTPSGPGTPVIVTVDDPLPQQAIKYVAAIAAVAISGFVSPPSAPARAAVISAAWAPADPAPQRPKGQMAAFTPQIAGDSPSGVGVPKIVVLPDDPLPQVNAKLPQPFVAGFVPYTRHLEVLGAWAPITFSLPSQAKIAPIAPAYPPPLVRHPEILAAWTAPAPIPVLPPKEAAIAIAADNPPLLKRSQDWTPWDPAVAVKLVVSSAATDGGAAPPPADNPPPLKRSQDWTPWDIAVPVKLVVSSAATDGGAAPPPVDNPPFGLHRFTAWGWGPMVAYPGGGGQFIPAGADNPPFNQRRLQDWFHWFDAVPVKLVVSHAATEGAAAPPPPVDNPPFGLHRFTAWGWGPLVGYPGGGGQFLPAPADNPPFNQRRTQDWTHFYPPPPLPTLTVKLVIGAPPDLHDQPPFTQRRTQDWSHWFQPYPLPTLRVLQTPPSGPEVITPPPIVTPPGGVGVRVGRYRQLKLKKKLKRDECEELLAYLRSLPPAELQVELEELQPRIASLLEMMPAAASVLIPAKPAEDDDDDDECIALLLEILNS